MRADRDHSGGERPVIHEDTWYRLSNSEQGYVLDVVNTMDNANGKIELRTEGNYSGQFWRILDVGDGHYSLQTRYLGSDKLLDVYGDDPRTPHLADRGNFSGQRWDINWIPGTDTFKLSNTYGGLYLVLDSRGAREVVMAPQNENSRTQRWRLTVIERIIS